MKVTLPWPPKALSPNARAHWAKKSRAAKQYRKTCYLLAKQAMTPETAELVQKAVAGEIKLALWLTFYPPDRRHRDDDNLVAAMKAGRDGLADALGIDDKHFRTLPYLSDQIRNGGAVVAVVTESPEVPGE